MRPKNLTKCMKLNWNIQRDGEVFEKIPSVKEVWIFSGTTHFPCILKLINNSVSLNLSLILTVHRFLRFLVSVFSLVSITKIHQKLKSVPDQISEVC